MVLGVSMEASCAWRMRSSVPSAGAARPAFSPTAKASTTMEVLPSTAVLLPLQESLIIPERFEHSEEGVTGHCRSAEA